MFNRRRPLPLVVPESPRAIGWIRWERSGENRMVRGVDPPEAVCRKRGDGPQGLKRTAPAFSRVCCIAEDAVGMATTVRASSSALAQLPIS